MPTSSLTSLLAAPLGLSASGSDAVLLFIAHSVRDNKDFTFVAKSLWHQSFASSGVLWAVFLLSTPDTWVFRRDHATDFGQTKSHSCRNARYQADKAVPAFVKYQLLKLHLNSPLQPFATY